MLDRTEVLRRLVDQARGDLQDASALEIIKWADTVLAGRLVIASSMQDAVIIDLVSQVRSGVDVVFLDTGYHFSQTIGMRDTIRATYPVRVLNVTASQTVEQQDAKYGPRLYERDPDRCCYLRKVKPLNTMLGLYDGWVTGLRSVETAARADAAAVEWDSQRSMLKINPVVSWTDDEVAAYITERGILVNPLVGAGYASIGCMPCTALPTGDDARSGRWAGSSKRECGIHL